MAAKSVQSSSLAAKYSTDYFCRKTVSPENNQMFVLGLCLFCIKDYVGHLWGLDPHTCPEIWGQRRWAKLGTAWSSVERGGAQMNQGKMEKQDKAVLKCSQEKLCRWEKQANDGTFS